jgi:DNA-binding response OmpR family regulator
VTVLLVGHLGSDHDSLRHVLGHSNWRLLHACSCAEALALLHQSRVPVVICERDLPDGNWRALLDEVSRLPSPPSVIVSSRLADECLWAEVLNLGGYDMLATPFEANEVFRVAFLAWHSWKKRLHPNGKAA